MDAVVVPPERQHGDEIPLRAALWLYSRLQDWTVSATTEVFSMARATAIWLVSANTALPSASLFVTVTGMPNSR